MKKVVLICSTPYTGSTLLAILLGAHKEIATISELTGVGQEYDALSYQCSCGEKLVDCSFYASVAREVLLQGADFNYQDFHTRFYDGQNRILRNVLYRSLYSAFADRVRDRLFGMSSPQAASPRYGASSAPRL